MPPIESSQGLQHFSRSEFPFSWAVEQTLDKLQRGDQGDRNSIEAAFVGTQLGQVVQDMFEASPNFAPKFLLDLVRFKIGHIISGDEMEEVLCEQVYRVAKAFAHKSFRDENDDFEVVNFDKEVRPSAVDIFMAIVTLKPRLQLAISLSKFLSKERNKPKQTTEAIDIAGQFSLDLRYMTEALETIEPDPLKMANDADRKIWTAQVTALSTYFKQVNQHPLSLIKDNKWA